MLWTTSGVPRADVSPDTILLGEKYDAKGIESVLEEPVVGIPELEVFVVALDEDAGATRCAHDPTPFS